MKGETFNLLEKLLGNYISTYTKAVISNKLKMSDKDIVILIISDLELNLEKINNKKEMYIQINKKVFKDGEVFYEHFILNNNIIAKFEIHYQEKDLIVRDLILEYSFNKLSSKVNK